MGVGLADGWIGWGLECEFECESMDGWRMLDCCRKKLGFLLESGSGGSWILEFDRYLYVVS